MSEEERQKIREELLQELQEQYKLIPIKEASLTVKDLIEKYAPRVAKKLNMEDKWAFRESLAGATRKVVCLKFGVSTLKEIPDLDKNAYREEFERFIVEYILGERYIKNDK